MADKRRSIFSRIVWLAIGLSIALVFGLWLLTDQTVRTTLDASARDEVDVDLAGLVDIHASSGPEELERRIADRLALVPATGNHPHYLLADRQSRRLAEDIAQWPPLDTSTSQAGVFSLADGAHAYGRATWLGPDLHLLVARETGDHDPLLRRIALVFAIGGAPCRGRREKRRPSQRSSRRTGRWFSAVSARPSRLSAIGSSRRPMCCCSPRMGW